MPISKELKRKAEIVVANGGDVSLAQLDATFALGDHIQTSTTLQAESKVILEAILAKEPKDAPIADFEPTNALLKQLLDKEIETKGIEDGLTALGVLIVENKAEKVDTKGIEALLGKLLKKEDEVIEITLKIA